MIVYYFYQSIVRNCRWVVISTFLQWNATWYLVFKPSPVISPSAWCNLCLAAAQTELIVWNTNTTLLHCTLALGIDRKHLQNSTQYIILVLVRLLLLILCDSSGIHNLKKCIFYLHTILKYAVSFSESWTISFSSITLLTKVSKPKISSFIMCYSAIVIFK